MIKHSNLGYHKSTNGELYLIDWSKAKTHSLTMWRRLLMKTLGSLRDPWTHPYWDSTRYTEHRPKNSDAALGQILDVDLFGQFPTTPYAFWHGPRSIGSFLELSFRQYKVHPNPSPYPTVAPILVQTAPGLRNGLEVDLVWASNLSWTALQDS